VLTVVKVGGGVGDSALPALCATLGELGERHPLIIVPGGAGFAASGCTRRHRTAWRSSAWSSSAGC
jgi:hypothetical protein